MFSIKTNLMRSLLTMLGIIIGVASVIAIVTLGNGGRDYIVGMIEDLGQNTVSINVDTSVATVSDYFTDADIEAVKKLDSVESVSPLIINIGTCSSDNETGMGFAVAGTPDLQYTMGIKMLYGRFFNEEDYKANRNVICIDNVSAFTFFGYENAVGKSIEFKLGEQAMKFKIIGISDATSMSAMDAASYTEMSQSFGGNMGAVAALIMPASTYNSLFSSSSVYAMLYLTAKDDNYLDAAGAAAVNVIRARHSNSDRDVYKTSNLATYIQLLDTVITIFTAFIAAVGAISLVVGGIGVMNIMLVSVTERTREIGIRKSLGAKTSTILFQFLTESVILCLIGGLIGLTIGVTGALTASAYVGIPIGIKFSTIALAVGFASAVGIFFGIYPARRAAKMLPIDALRRE